MTKKFFSLIHGEKIHLSPNTKVIPADRFSMLIDAQEVIKQVKIDAENYKAEVVTECEKLKVQAQKEGFEQGFADWVGKISEMEKEIRKVREDMQKVVVPIALRAAKKIVGREINSSDTAIIDIIANSLKSVSQHKKINIYVNRKDFEAVEKNRKKIKNVFENLEALSIQPNDDVESGGCIIETEAGIINAQLENQWIILENAFQKLVQAQNPFGVEQVAPKPVEVPQKEREETK